MGPAARATGLVRDVRHDHPHGIYQFAHIPVMTAHYGDVNSRAVVRWLEMQQSLQFVAEQLAALPADADPHADGPAREGEPRRLPRRRVAGRDLPRGRDRRRRALREVQDHRSLVPQLVRLWPSPFAAGRSPTFRSATRASTSPTAGTTCEAARMLKALRARLAQGHRTTPFPDGPPPALPERFRGLPSIDAARCPEGCRDCASACPTGAISVGDGGVSLDLGKCLFCPECERACPRRRSLSRATTGWRCEPRSARHEGARDRAGRGPRREAPPALRTVAEAPPGQRGGMQRLRSRRQRPLDRRLGHRAVRNPDRRVAAARGRPSDHRPGHREHATGSREDVRRRSRPEDRHRRRRLRHLGGPLPRPARAARRCRLDRPGRPLHSRLSPASADDPRRAPPAPRPDRIGWGEKAGSLTS